MAYLEIKNLSFSYTLGNPLLEDISFSLNKGEIGVLLGSSGSGKTSCLRCLAGFEQALSGQTTLDGVQLFGEGISLAPHKRRIGYLFQGLSLFPHMTVSENVAYGIEKLSRLDQRNRVQELLKLIGLESHADKYPAALSGGEKQRVALARALAPRPSMIMMDEPFSSLDPDLRVNLRVELLEILKSQNTTALIVTHDLTEAFQMGDKIGVIDQGKLLQWGTPEELFHQPVSETVARRTGPCLIITGKIIENGFAETEIGNLKISTNVGIRESHIIPDLVRILIRPSDLELHESASGPFTVRTKHWLGTSYDLQLRTNSGQFPYVWKGETAPDKNSKLALKHLPSQNFMAWRL